MAETSNSIKRQVAYKTRINDLMSGTYIKNEGEWAPNYVELGNKQISRVNLIGVVVLKPLNENMTPSVVIEDGTGKISVRTFEDSGIFETVNVGDVVLLIGRIREFGTERYIVPEILKKLENKDWIKVRQLEFKGMKSIQEVETAPIRIDKLPAKKEELIEEEIIEDSKVVEEIKEKGAESPTDKVFNLIKEIDTGAGANYDDVITKSNMDDTEKIIRRLLEEGDVFEVRPGKLKVLE